MTTTEGNDKKQPKMTVEKIKETLEDIGEQPQIIKVLIMPSEYMQERGTAILVCHPEDKKIFENAIDTKIKPDEYK